MKGKRKYISIANFKAYVEQYVIACRCRPHKKVQTKWPVPDKLSIDRRGLHSRDCGSNICNKDLSGHETDFI